MYKHFPSFLGGEGVESQPMGRSMAWFHGGYVDKNQGIFEMAIPFLMHRDTAIGYLDMDELTFERFMVPVVTRLKFGGETYFLTEQLEMAVYMLVESSSEHD